VTAALAFKRLSPEAQAALTGLALNVALLAWFWRKS